MSVAATHNITIDQGSDFELSVILQEEDGTVNDLTNYSARAQLRKTKDAATISASFSTSIPAPTTGEILVTLGNSVTSDLASSATVGEYFYDLEIFTSDDSIARRVLQGRVLVTQEVTR